MLQQVFSNTKSQQPSFSGWLLVTLEIIQKRLKMKEQKKQNRNSHVRFPKKVVATY